MTLVAGTLGLRRTAGWHGGTFLPTENDDREGHASIAICMPRVVGWHPAAGTFCLGPTERYGE